ncbi:MAG: hypothetical protein AABY53_06055 [Bdellovibrionota bacterium]
MKKTILATLVTFLSFSVQADVINCFSESIRSTYSMSQLTLTYLNMQAAKGEKKEFAVFKNVSFQIRSPGVFELVSKEKKVLQTLSLNNQGSDGRSDMVYPYNLNDTSGVMFESVNQGGCTSNYFKAK